MKKALKIALVFVMMLSVIMSFSSCSSKKAMTEENITKTVQIVNTALKEFDTKTLKKYVDSETLNTIIGFAEKHEQFVKLGQAMFKNLTMTVESVDIENQTVTIKATNSNLEIQARNFAKDLKENYTTMQLLKALNNKRFLNSKLSYLIGQIDMADFDVEATVTLKVTQGKRNLVLSFDEEAENAVSGGALTAIKGIYN